MGKKREVLVVASKVKEAVKAHKCRSGGDLTDALSDRVHEILEAAAARAKHNGRRTVRPFDL